MVINYSQRYFLSQVSPSRAIHGDQSDGTKGGEIMSRRKQRKAERKKQQAKIREILKDELREIRNMKGDTLGGKELDPKRWIYKCPLCDKTIAPPHDLDAVTSDPSNCFYKMAKNIEIYGLKILYCDYQNGHLFNDGWKKAHHKTIKQLPRKVKRLFKKLKREVYITV